MLRNFGSGAFRSISINSWPALPACLAGMAGWLGEGYGAPGAGGDPQVEAPATSAHPALSCPV